MRNKILLKSKKNILVYMVPITNPNLIVAYNDLLSKENVRNNKFSIDEFFIVSNYKCETGYNF